MEMVVPKNLPNLITVKEASLYLRVPLTSIYHLLRCNRLPGIRVGGRWRINRDILDKEVLNLNDEVKNYTALLLSSDPQSCKVCFNYFQREQILHEIVQDKAEAEVVLRRQKFEVILADANFCLPISEFLNSVHQQQPHAAIVLIAERGQLLDLEVPLGNGPVTVLRGPITPVTLSQFVRQLGIISEPSSTSLRR